MRQVHGGKGKLSPGEDSEALAERDRVELTFVLESPPLRVRQVKLELNGGDADTIRAWLRKNPNTLAEGDIYTRQKEVATRVGHCELLRSARTSGRGGFGNPTGLSVSGQPGTFK